MGSDYDDILQEGMIGLYKAVQNFNIDKNVSFDSFASLCINRQIQNAVKLANSKKNLPLNDYVSIGEKGEMGDKSSPQLIIATKDRIVENIYFAKEENSQIIKKIKDCLNETQFKILLMYLSGYSYSEIANLLCVNEKKIDNNLQIIKKKLKNLTFLLE